MEGAVRFISYSSTIFHHMKDTATNSRRPFPRIWTLHAYGTKHYHLHIDCRGGGGHFLTYSQPHDLISRMRCLYLSPQDLCAARLSQVPHAVLLLSTSSLPRFPHLCKLHKMLPQCRLHLVFSNSCGNS